MEADEEVEMGKGKNKHGRQGSKRVINLSTKIVKADDASQLALLEERIGVLTDAIDRAHTLAAASRYGKAITEVLAPFASDGDPVSV
jgi:hypothetical protein